MDGSYRIFNCARCAKQTILCRYCDHGNIYCSAICAQQQRALSLKRSARKYQKTLKGKHQHAERQLKYRQRQASKKVTHQGLTDVHECGALEVEQQDCKKVKTQTYRPSFKRELRCDHCGRVCGPFGRRDFWRSGRKFQKLKRRNGEDESGD